MPQVEVTPKETLTEPSTEGPEETEIKEEQPKRHRERKKVE